MTVAVRGRFGGCVGASDKARNNICKGIWLPALPPSLGIAWLHRGATSRGGVLVHPDQPPPAKTSCSRTRPARGFQDEPGS